MNELRKQLNVIAISDGSTCGLNAVAYGELLSRIFNSSLTIFSDFDFKKKKHNTAAAPSTSEADFQELKQRFATEKRELFIENSPFRLDSLIQYAESHNTALFVIGAQKSDETTFFSRKKAFKFIKPMRQPVLVVGDTPPAANAFKNVLLPIDIQPQSKEKMLWAGYFNRFYHATIYILHTTYRDEVLQRKITEHKAFAEKLYNNLGIKDFRFYNITPTIDNMDAYSLKFAPEVGGTLSIIMTTLYPSLVDLLLGVREKKLIANGSGFPVLCINPREDLYVLCT